MWVRVPLQSLKYFVVWYFTQVFNKTLWCKNFSIVLNSVWKRKGKANVPDSIQGFIDGYKDGVNYFIGLQNLYLLLLGKSVNLRVYGFSDVGREVVYHNVSIKDNNTYNIGLDGFTKGGKLN